MLRQYHIFKEFWNKSPCLYSLSKNIYHYLWIRYHLIGLITPLLNNSLPQSKKKEVVITNIFLFVWFCRYCNMLFSCFYEIFRTYNCNFVDQLLLGRMKWYFKLIQKISHVFKAIIVTCILNKLHYYTFLSK